MMGKEPNRFLMIQQRLQTILQMKKLTNIWLLLLVPLTGVLAQVPRGWTDQHVVHQQERMVYTQWDRKKFTPSKGFLGLNPLYWLTWAWHPNYPKTDRRPLSGSGPQTLRLGMVLAMQQAAESYKKHTDTIRHVAMSQALRYSSLARDADPLWLLYYRKEFQGLTGAPATDPLAGLSGEVRDYLQTKGLLAWYTEEWEQLRERLAALQAATLERGSRLMAYHRLLTEYRKLQSAWEAKKRYAAKYLSLTKNPDLPGGEQSTQPRFSGHRSDVQIAEEILRKNQ